MLLDFNQAFKQIINKFIKFICLCLKAIDQLEGSFIWICFITQKLDQTNYCVWVDKFLFLVKNFESIGTVVSLQRSFNQSIHSISVINKFTQRLDFLHIFKQLLELVKKSWCTKWFHNLYINFIWVITLIFLSHQNLDQLFCDCGLFLLLNPL